MKPFSVAVVGATGMVGRKMLQVLGERNLPISALTLFASSRSQGKILHCKGVPYAVRTLTQDAVKECQADYALFSAGAAVSEAYAPLFVRAGTVVIDNSSRWRTDPAVPLVVPEVNASALERHAGVIANPNCSTIQAAVVLAPLHRAYGLKRITYSTYQAVSGAGRQGVLDLEEGARGAPPKKFPMPIYGNILPQVDAFLENGYTKEEEKMIFETRKILGEPTLRVTATTARVPVLYGHSESICVEFTSPVTVEGVRKTLQKSEGVVVLDDPIKGVYPTPLIAADRDEVFVGRIRKDESVESGVHLWVVADNLRKGAATNAVQILQKLTERK